LLCRLPRSSPVPYTTLFRSEREVERAAFTVPEQLQPAFEAEVRRGSAQGEILPAGRTGLRPEGADGLVHVDVARALAGIAPQLLDRKSTRLNSSHVKISYAV